MTLVYGLRSGRRVDLLSDTTITDPGEASPNVLPGRLKAVVLRRDLCVGYAGRSVPAIDAIRALPASPVGCDDVVGALHAAHLASDQEVDFIVASCEPEARLVRISGGDAYEGAEDYWIGSPEAATHLKERLASPEGPFSSAALESNGVPVNLRALLAAQAAFDSVVNDAGIPGVGGLVLGASSAFGGFNYTSGVRTCLGSPKTLTVGPEPSAIPIADSAAEGGFAYSVITPSEAGAPFVGVYFYQGQFAVLYHPLDRDDASYYRGVSVEQFQRAVEREYGVSLECSVALG